MGSAAQPSQHRLAEELYELIGPVRIRFCPLELTARQEAFLLLAVPEVFFGGAAGGGKTVALLAAALQYCDVPGYHALLVRRSLTELQLPGNLIELSHNWLASSRASWNGDLKQWRFPGPSGSGAGGATLTFGYLASDDDVYRYSGASFSYLGFDELTRFPELHYRRMFRILRQPTGTSRGPAGRDGTQLADVPVRVRAASNPGGEHHEWVKTHFVDPTTRANGALFLPSRLEDNPHLDHDAYNARLNSLPPAERERLRYGNWDIPDDGELFRREWFTIIEPHQLPKLIDKVRYWDLAGSAPTAVNPNPDYTVGLLLALGPDKSFYVRDIIRTRKAPGAIEQLIAKTAEHDGRDVTIVIEEEPGGAGKALTDRYKRTILHGYACKSDRPTGAKDIRAHPAAAAAENGLIKIVRGAHSQAFLDELSSFPHGRHDDTVDALTGAHKYLSTRTRSRAATLHRPKGRIPGVRELWWQNYYNFPM